jgi:hypothetical protein
LNSREYIINVQVTLLGELTLGALILQRPENPCLDGVGRIRWVEKGGPPVIRIVVPCVVLLLLAGCKGGSTTSGKPGPSGGPAPTGTQDGGPHPTNTHKSTEKVHKLTVKFEGQTADVWAKVLMDPKGDEINSMNAAGALREIGEESLPFLIKAMESNTNYVKLNALWVLEDDKKDWPRKAAKELAPVLNKALEDYSSDVRKKAAAVIAVWQFPESVAALQKAATNEQDSGVKRKMEEYLEKINKK